jgi:hypothetical protein
MVKKWIDKFIYKPGSTDIYWEKIISSIVVISGFVVFLVFNNKRLGRLKDERNRFRRYVIGVTTAEHNNIKGPMVVEYEYSFAGVHYSTATSTKDWLWNKPNTHGGRYYVELAYNNPTNAEISFEYPVPDSVTNGPDSGWVTMPGYH